MNYCNYVVYDYETSGLNTATCDPVQIAAMVVDGRKLEPIPGAVFESKMKPRAEFVESGTLEFHARLHGKPTSEILSEWEKYPPQKQVWENFNDFLLRYHVSPRRAQYTAPIPVGYNTINFDDKISARLQKEIMDGKYLFHYKNKIDLMDVVYLFFENSGDLTSHSADSLREYLGASKEGAHDALVDVRFCVELLTRFLKVFRRTTPKINFKGSFAQTLSTGVPC